MAVAEVVVEAGEDGTEEMVVFLIVVPAAPKGEGEVKAACLPKGVTEVPGFVDAGIPGFNIMPDEIFILLVLCVKINFN